MLTDHCPDFSFLKFLFFFQFPIGRIDCLLVLPSRRQVNPRWQNSFQNASPLSADHSAKLECSFPDAMSPSQPPLVVCRLIATWVSPSQTPAVGAVAWLVRVKERERDTAHQISIPCEKVNDFRSSTLSGITSVGSIICRGN